MRLLLPWATGLPVELLREGRPAAATAPARIQHDNGAGGSYFSCDPLDTYSAANAQAAALSWSAQGTDQSAGLFCGGSCFAWQTSNACGVWCYSGTNAGKAKVNGISIACICPDALSPAWH